MATTKCPIPIWPVHLQGPSNRKVEGWDGMQGLTMDLRMGAHFSITSASLSAFDTIAIIILVPIYDRLLIPVLRRFNMAPTYLQRIGIGLGVSPVRLPCRHNQCILVFLSCSSCVRRSSDPV